VTSHAFPLVPRAACPTPAAMVRDVKVEGAGEFGNKSITLNNKVSKLK